MERKLNESEKKFLKDKNNTQAVFQSNELSLKLINVISNFLGFSSQAKEDKIVQDEEEPSFLGSIKNFMDRKKREFEKIIKVLSIIKDFVGEKTYNQMVKIVGSYYLSFSSGIDIQKEISNIVDSYPEFKNDNKNNELSNFISGYYDSYVIISSKIIDYLHLEKKIPLLKENKDFILQLSYIALIGNLFHLKQINFLGIIIKVLLEIIVLALDIYFSMKELFLALIENIIDIIFSIIEFIIDFVVFSIKLISKILQFLKENIVKIFKAIIKEIDKIWQFIKNIEKKIWEFIKSLALKILNKISDLVNILKNYIMQLIKKITNCLYRIFHLILDNFSVSFCLYFAIFAVAIGAMIFYLRKNSKKEGLDLNCDCMGHGTYQKVIRIVHPVMWILSIIGFNKNCRITSQDSPSDKIFEIWKKTSVLNRNCIYCGQ